MNTEKPIILIIDDDEEIRSQLKWAVADSYQVVLAENRETALAAACAYSRSVQAEREDASLPARMPMP